MTPELTVGLVFVLFLLTIVAGLPIAIAMGGTGFLGIWFINGPMAAFGQLRSVPYSIISSYALAVVPFFLLMGSFVWKSGLAEAAYRFANLFIGRLRGSLGMATTIGSAIMGAASGSTVANAVAFTHVALPEMLKMGYRKDFATGCIAAAGTLAVLIPPSIGMVVYGILTETSIGKLLIAGIIPGVLEATTYCLGIYIYARLKPGIAPLPLKTRVTWQERITAGREVSGIMVLFIVVVGGIYSGLFTATSAGAVGAFGALLILLFSGKATTRGIFKNLTDATATTSMLFFCLVGGNIFGRFLAVSGVSGSVSEFLVNLPVHRFTILVMICGIYFIAGFFVDPISVQILTLPIFFPAVVKMGYDPIWFGVIVVKLAEMAVITPPVGFNCYAVKMAAGKDVSLEEVFRGTMPFVVMDIVDTGLLLAFPQISLFLVNSMFGAG